MMVMADHHLNSLSRELQRRGVQASLSSLLEFASVDAIERSIEWWDRLPDAAPAVLVGSIRGGGIPARHTDSVQYGEQIVAWLTEYFPELADEHGRPHPAAVAAVIRLHHRRGKGQLTKREHGPEIRAAVKAWAKRYETTDGDFSEAELAMIAERRAQREAAPQ
jgi:hypothetical protein